MTLSRQYQVFLVTPPYSHCISRCVRLPKTATAACPLTNAPGVANPAALQELNIAVVKEEKKEQ